MVKVNGVNDSWQQALDFALSCNLQGALIGSVLPRGGAALVDPTPAQADGPLAFHMPAIAGKVMEAGRAVVGPFAPAIAVCGVPHFFRMDSECTEFETVIRVDNSLLLVLQASTIRLEVRRYCAGQARSLLLAIGIELP